VKASLVGRMGCWLGTRLHEALRCDEGRRTELLGVGFGVRRETYNLGSKEGLRRAVADASFSLVFTVGFIACRRIKGAVHTP